MDYQQLCQDFPDMFQRDPDGPHSFDHYGFQCGLGWLPLIHDLAAKITLHAAEQAAVLKTKQIKSKFGSLRWYIDGADEQIRRWIEETSLRLS